MRRLVDACLLLSALLVAAALDDEVDTRLSDVCRHNQDSIVCTCSPEHPEIDVVSADTGFLSNASVITMENCPEVKLAPYSLEQANKLRKLSVLNVSHLALTAPLPDTIEDLVLSRIGKLDPIPVYVFQGSGNMNTLIIQDVTFEGVEPYFLIEAKMNFTKITGCSFPSLSENALYINSHNVAIKSNSFSSLDAGALVVVSENATLSDNSFQALVNGSIQWRRWPRGLQSELSFERNTIHSLEVAALTRLLATENSIVSDNVLLCSAEEFKRCKEKVMSSELKVCDAENVCPYRNRTELTETLAKARHCHVGSLPNAEECAVLLVRGAGHLQTASSVATAAAFLLLTWFSA